MGVANGCWMFCVLQSSCTEHLGERWKFLLGKAAHSPSQPSAQFLGKCAVEDLESHQADSRGLERMGSGRVSRGLGGQYLSFFFPFWIKSIRMNFNMSCRWK